MSVLFHITRLDRKILDRARRTSTSGMASGRPLHRLIIRSRAVNFVQLQDAEARVSCWILQLWFEQQITGPQIPAFAVVRD